ncbi:ribbon-helix-helix domain-containing protein [Piscicoccus intestinalis]|uniref:ribbon-helix-helix domain-containing protein n=1 Tax=Piscicoccus intestinalis TaxID=746033 RepID=UPI003570E071
MNVQVSVRLDERLVERLDDLVRSGEARSRAEVVEWPWSVSCAGGCMPRTSRCTRATGKIPRPKTSWSGRAPGLIHPGELMREIRLARMGKTRPVVVLTREAVREYRP